MNDQESQVKELIAKAAKAENPDHALKFSQAACNAANALCGLSQAKTQWPKK